MLQSTQLDPVLGLDLHLVAVPAPPILVPTPIPMPFVGIVFDLLGLLVGAAISMVQGEAPSLVLVNSVPATNCGTAVTNGITLPHVSAPGIVFLPSCLPVKIGDAELMFGASQVFIQGALAVRFGEMAMSCSDPVRMPTSIVLAIPKGLPVLTGGESVPDMTAIGFAILQHAAMALLRALARGGANLLRGVRRGSAFMGRVSDAMGDCHASSVASRYRRAKASIVRFVTGHPIDVVTGNLWGS